MRRAGIVFAASTLAVFAACADSNEGPPVEDDGGAPHPPVEAGSDVDAPGDAGTDVDARAPLSKCENGWCVIDLPEVRSWGLNTVWITGLATETAGSVWATTRSYRNGAGDSTSHLRHYENGTWKVHFGITPQQSEPFPYVLESIASNGAGAFMAVGRPEWSAPRPGPVVLRVKDGKVDAEYPTGLPGFKQVVFTSPTEAWALDVDGNVYRSDESGSEPSGWVLETTPHPRDPSSFGTPAKTIFRGTDGSLWIAERIDGKWTPDGYIRGYTYTDHRTREGDGGIAWTSSTLDDDQSLNAGVASGPESVWLAAGSYLYGSTGTGAGMSWPLRPPPTSVEILGMWARGPNDVWGVGNVGRVFRYDGTSWADARLTLNGAPLSVEGLKTITGLPSGEIWAGGIDVFIHREPGNTP